MVKYLYPQEEYLCAALKLHSLATDAQGKQLQVKLIKTNA